MTRPSSSVDVFLFRQWVGGTFAMLGFIWIGLIVRDMYLSTMSVDSTPSMSEQFFSFRTGYYFAAALAMFIAGIFLLFPTQTLEQREYRSKRRHRRRHRRHEMPSAAPAHPEAPLVSDDTVSFEMNSDTPITGLPVDGLTVAPIPGTRKKVRVKQRVRVRIRKGEQ